MQFDNATTKNVDRTLKKSLTINNGEMLNDNMLKTFKLHEKFIITTKKNSFVVKSKNNQHQVQVKTG